ncbi:transcriptional regulator, Crp/Fnr family [Desulfovibrio sp. X2]|uniref:Crp/Fnr family transcriptional regulator n=1 Tax=Desulfovibrio sp. X2 TaxID=941449 RepID=UPI000358E8D2|nr:Crp/Fnr family transcriptional regulator [Desulfovibrio sp. X2]EPR37494.1 transcriptional regulator, Crp/Fnr family [Desulfovibrio sp. X2]
MTQTDLVRAIDFFNGLPDAQAAALSAIAHTERAPRGKEIFREGEEAAGLYGVLEGRVKIAKLSPTGKEQILHILGPGELFAEVPVFAGKSYPATAAAVDDSRLLFIPRRAFRDMLAGDPDLAMGMLAILSTRLREFARKIEALSLKEVPERLAAHLLLLRGEQDSDRLRLDLPKGQLAALLGTIPETLSRVLKKMAEAGYIRVEGSQVTVADTDGLSALAQGLERL